MGWTREVWRQGVAGFLFEFANMDFQKDLWSGKLKGYSSFFDEAICHFDDYGIPEYLHDFLDKGFLTKDESEVLKKLSISIDAYCDGKNNESLKHEALWADKQWAILCCEFKRAFDSFRGDFIESGEPHTKWISDYPIKS